MIPNQVEAGERIHQRARPPKHPYQNRLTQVVGRDCHSLPFTHYSPASKPSIKHSEYGLRF